MKDAIKKGVLMREAKFNLGSIEDYIDELLEVIAFLQEANILKSDTIEKLEKEIIALRGKNAHENN